MAAVTTHGALKEKQDADTGSVNIAMSEGSCESCFFGTSELCSLPKKEACPTFRPQWMVQVRSDRS